MYDGIVQSLRKNKEFRHNNSYLFTLLISIYFVTYSRPIGIIISDFKMWRNIALINNKFSYSKLHSPNKVLNPWFVTGFCDAEASFTMSVFKSKTAAIGWTIEPSFIINLHVKDIELLNNIKLFFGVGSVSTSGDKVARYRVRSREDLKVIISHFNNYPLQTTKVINFKSFCIILEHMNNKLHTNVEGFLSLLSLINKLNNPLSEALLEKLSSLGKIPNVDLEICSSESLDLNTKLNPWWISGFATGEGSFTFFTRKRVNASGNTVKDYTLAFEVSQRSDSLHVLTLIVNTLGLGKVYSEARGVSKFRLVPKDLILNDLVPFFEKYPLEGNKALQYSIWIKIVEVLHKNPRSDFIENKVEALIKELSSLNK